MPGTTKFEQKGKKKDQTGADLYSKGRGRHKKMGGGYTKNKYTGKSMMMNRGGYNKGGYASVADMEKACGSKTVKNTMRQKYEESK